MSDLVFIAFDNEKQAEEVRDKVLEMQREYLIEVDDAVVVVRDQNSRVKLNQLMHPAAGGAVAGAFWGMLIGWFFLMPVAGAAVGAAGGALGGALVDVGINDQDMKQQANEALKPGTAGLFLLIRKMTTDKVLEGPKGRRRHGDPDLVGPRQGGRAEDRHVARYQVRPHVRRVRPKRAAPKMPRYASSRRLKRSRPTIWRRSSRPPTPPSQTFRSSLAGSGPATRSCVRPWTTSSGTATSGAGGPSGLQSGPGGGGSPADRRAAGRRSSADSS